MEVGLNPHVEDSFGVDPPSGFPVDFYHDLLGTFRSVPHSLVYLHFTPWLLFWNSLLFALFQVLEMIAPPYSPDFVALMLPIVQSKEITDTLRTSNGDDDVSQFLSMI